MLLPSMHNLDVNSAIFISYFNLWISQIACQVNICLTR